MSNLINNDLTAVGLKDKRGGFRGKLSFDNIFGTPKQAAGG
jgi:hypothetical protein